MYEKLRKLKRSTPAIKVDAMALRTTGRQYENLRKLKRSKPAIKVDAIASRTTGRQYENLRIGNGQSDGRNINENSNGKDIQWKDLGKRIRCTIYAFFLVLFLLCSIVVAAFVLVYLLKGEDKYYSDGDGSNLGSLVACGEGCGGSIKCCLQPNQRAAKFGKGCGDHNISFFAYGATTVNSNSVIKFPSIYSNSGNGYSSDTGRFTCKYPGIYYFAVILTKPKKRIIDACLRINGKEKLRLRTAKSDPDDTVLVGCSMFVTGNFHLNTNDYVDIYLLTGKYQNNCCTYFSGTLVIPDNR